MMRSRIRVFLDELRRRRVYRVAVVYLVLAWGLLQLGDVVIEPLGLPAWAMPFVIFLVAIGFPVAVVLAWAYDVTPEGVRRTPAGPAGPTAPPPTGAARPASATTPARTWIPNPPPAPAGRWSAGGMGIGVLVGLVGVGWLAWAGAHEHPAGPTHLAGFEASALRSIAVLPFVNASADPENEFFADGVTDDILTHLAVVPDFTVISRTSAMRYKGSDRGTVEIAAELGVAYVLEGSVRRAGDRVRITARLVDGRTDRHLWAETYDRQLRDIFQVQTEIATAIAGALEAELSSGVAARIERRPTASLEAYDTFLLGRERFYRYDREGTEAAIAAFRSALDLDPDFTLARAWLARAYAIYAFNHGAGPAFSDSAVAIGRRAVAEQPDLADAQAALGVAFVTAGRYDDAIPTLQRAAELNPNDWASIANLGLLHGIRGQYDEAIRMTRHSLQRDPARSFLAYSNLASYYIQLGLYDTAARTLDRSLSLNPDYGQSIATAAWLDFHFRARPEATRAAAERLAADPDPGRGADAGRAFLLLGDPQSALSVLARTHQQVPTAQSNHIVGILYAQALLATGDRTRADSILADTERLLHDLIAARGEAQNAAYSMAAVHNLRGNRDEAFRWLERAIDHGSGSAVLSLDPVFENLHDDPRFTALTRRVDADIATMRARVEREGW
jgi:adenylate cyclase